MSDTSIYTPTRQITPQQAAMLAQLQLLPEWSISQQQFQPLDSGYQRDQISYFDNVLNTVADPLLAILTGTFSPTAFEPSYEEEVIDEGSSEGRDRLMAIIERSPGTQQALIAAALLDGDSPDMALQRAGIVRPEKTDDDPKPDTSTYDRFLKFADEAWQGLISDRPRQVRTKETPSPWMERAQNLGIGDPTERYTADHFATPQSSELATRSDFARRAMEAALQADSMAQRALEAENYRRRGFEGRQQSWQRGMTPRPASQGVNPADFIPNPTFDDIAAARRTGFLPNATDDFFLAASQAHGRAPRAIGGRERSQQRSTPTSTRSGPTTNQTRARDARIQANKAKQAYFQAEGQRMIDEARRAAVARALGDMGRTPSVDLLLSRLGALPGVGR